MESILSVLLGVRVERNRHGLLPFSLDEAILGLKQCFLEWSFAKVLQVLLRLVDVLVCERLIGKSLDPIGMLKNLNHKACCDDAWFLKSRDATRTVGTTICKLELTATRLRCGSCGRSFVPLFVFLGLTRYQNKSNELTKVVFEMVIDQTYRRSKKQLDQLTGTVLSLGQLWRTTMRDKRFIKITKNELQVGHFWRTMDEQVREVLKQDSLHAILADGTGFKLQKAPINVARELKKMSRPDSKFTDKARPLQSEVRVIYGLTKSNQVIPLGVYTNQESWKQIGNDLYKRFGKSEKLKKEPIAEVLIADGEEAIFTGLKKLVKTEQRCQWHFTHDFKVVFQYLDNGSKVDRIEYQKKIQVILDELHQKIVSEVKPSEQKKLELHAEIIKSELQLSKLADRLHETNNENAEQYVRNTINRLFTYLKHYLRLAHLGPKVTSQLERFMREIGRRIKKIAWNWSARGVATLGYIILVRQMNKQLWENYWNKILNVTGNIKLTSEGAVIKMQDQSLLH